MYRDAISSRIHIVYGNFKTQPQDVIYRLQEWLGKHSGSIPLIVIDYLQPLAPTGARLTDKQAVDSAVFDLKDFQSANDLTMVVISSLNRANYLTPVSFESFKETGGIECTADVVWGLDLACLRDKFFDKTGQINKKREIVNQAKKDCPREIVLQCLKNRFGPSSYSVGFYFDPVHDIFTPAPSDPDDETKFIFKSRPGTYHDKLAEATGSIKSWQQEKAASRRESKRAKTARAVARTRNELINATESIQDEEARAKILIAAARKQQAAYDESQRLAKEAAREESLSNDLLDIWSELES